MADDTTAAPTEAPSKVEVPDQPDTTSAVGRVFNMDRTLKRDHAVVDALEPSALTPPKITAPPDPTPHTDPMQAFGQPAMWLAIFGSLVSRQHLTAAVTSGAGVLAATQKLDAEQAKNQYDQWKVNSKNALETAKYVQNSYKAAISKLSADARGAASEVGTLAKAFKDDAMLHIYETQGMDGVVRFLKGRKNQLDDAEVGGDLFGKHVEGQIGVLDKIAAGFASDDPTKQADALDLYGTTLGKGVTKANREATTATVLKLKSIAYTLRNGTPEQVAAAQQEAAAIPGIASGILHPPKAAPTPGSVQANRAAIAKGVASDPAWKDKPADQQATETERRFKKSQALMIDKETADWIAQEVWSGNPSAVVGMARSANNMTLVAESIKDYAKANNKTPEDMNAKIAEFRSQMSEAQTLGHRVGAIEVSGQEAKKMAGLVEAAFSRLGRDQFRPFNQLKVLYDNQTSSPEQASAYLADFSLATAYARALNPQGVPRETDIAKAEQMLSTYDSYERHMAGVDQILLELDQIEAATGEARNAMINRIRGVRGFAPETSGAAKPLPAGAPQEGATSTSKSGKPIVFRNGNWEYQ